MFIVFICVTVLLLSPPAINGVMQTYDVHWLGGSTIIERDISGLKQSIDIYCYPGTSKSLLTLWQTVKFNIKIKGNDDDFQQYTGGTPDAVFSQYTENSYGWNVIPFQKRSAKTINLELFNSTCMAINTKQKHSIEFQVIRVDIWRVLLMVIGIATIFSSRALSGNPIFFYLCGILIGVSASFMVLVFYVSKLLPKKTLTYGILIGGWTVGVYLFQQLWENIRSIMFLYQTQVFWYTLIVGFVSFLVCYRIGPPKDRRSQNLVMWTLQLVGVIMIFFSSEYQEAAAAIIVTTLVVKYFPHSWLYSLKGYWLRNFPPQPNLLTSEEYYEQGARETKQALDGLRKYCSSPDCAQWKIMLKLNDTKRFASFVEGDSHLSDDEIVNYESYAFSLDRNRKCTNIANSTPSNMEISDDDSSQSDDEF